MILLAFSVQFGSFSTTCYSYCIKHRGFILSVHDDDDNDDGGQVCNRRDVVQPVVCWSTVRI